MKLDFGNRRVTLVVSPVDLRMGFNKLALMADVYLDIDLGRKEDVVGLRLEEPLSLQGDLPGRERVRHHPPQTQRRTVRPDSHGAEGPAAMTLTNRETRGLFGWGDPTNSAY